MDANFSITAQLEKRSQMSGAPHKRMRDMSDDEDERLDMSPKSPRLNNNDAAHSNEMVVNGYHSDRSESDLEDEDVDVGEQYVLPSNPISSIIAPLACS